MDQDYGNIWDHPLDIGNVVNTAVGVEKMRARHVALTALQCEQSAETSHVSRSDFDVRMPLLQLIFQYSDRQIMASGAKNRVLDIRERPEQFDIRFFTGVQPLDETGNAHQTIRMDHRRNNACTARQRHRHYLLADSAQRHADKFFQAEMRSNLFRQNGTNVRVSRRARS